MTMEGMETIEALPLDQKLALAKAVRDSYVASVREGQMPLYPNELRALNAQIARLES